MDSVCSVGKLLKEACHKLSYTRGKTGLKTVNEYSDDDKELIIWRSGLLEDPTNNICFHHEQTILYRYEHFKKKCCNPHQVHKVEVRGMYDNSPVICN